MEASASEERIKQLNGSSDVHKDLKCISIGSLLWAKLDIANIDASSWWPAQVVDDKAVSEDNIFNDKIEGGILVRYYGSCIYVWMDPVTVISDFQNSFKGKNSNPLIEFLGMLTENNSAKYVAEPEKRANEHSPSSKEENPKRASTKKRKVGKDNVSTAAKSNDKRPSMEHGTQNSSGEPSGPDGMSSRKLKLMRTLGLAPPPGSPF